MSREGVEAYEAGLFELSIEYFRSADRLYPSAAHSFNIARAHERLGNEREALTAYREYLSRAPGSPHATLVNARITALSERAADRAPAGSPGESAPATAAQVRRQSDAEAGVHPSALPSRNPATEHASESRKPWAIVALAAGGVALTGAGVFEWLRRDAESDVRDARRDPERSQLDHAELIDRAESRQTAAQISFGLGAALLTTGTILWLLDEPVRDRAARASVSFEPGAVRAGVTTRF
jgi:hypothetical protein